MMVRLALHARPDAVLVTDAVATESPVVERDGAAYLADGTLAGSTLTMDARAAQRRGARVAAARAVRHATANPARVIGVHRSRPGRPGRPGRSRRARPGDARRPGGVDGAGDDRARGPDR